MKLIAIILLAMTPAADAASFNVSALQSLNLAAVSGGYRAGSIPLPADPVFKAELNVPADMGARLLAASDKFLGVPYVLGPLGEGANCRRHKRGYRHFFRLFPLHPARFFENSA